MDHNNLWYCIQFKYEITSNFEISRKNSALVISLYENVLIQTWNL